MYWSLSGAGCVGPGSCPLTYTCLYLRIYVHDYLARHPLTRGGCCSILLLPVVVKAPCPGANSQLANTCGQGGSPPLPMVVGQHK